MEQRETEMTWGQMQRSDYCRAQWVRLGDQDGGAMRQVVHHEEVVLSMDSHATDVRWSTLGHWKE